MSPSASRTWITLVLAGTLPALGWVAASEAVNPPFGFHRTAISGRLTYNGVPVSHSMVYLVPAAAHHGEPVALGGVQPDGSFMLHYGVDVQSIPSGRYTLFIRLAGTDPQGIPARFADPKTSGLDLTLDDEPAQIDIALRN